MNEVVPWSTRARESIVSAARRAGRLAASRWSAFTDLGIGAVLAGLGILVAAGIGVAVIQGRSGPEPVPCTQARDYVATIQHLGHSGPLTAGQVARLRNDSSALTAIAATARGDDAKAITDAATVAGSATAGQTLDTGTLDLEFGAACIPGGATGGGFNRM